MEKNDIRDKEKLLGNVKIQNLGKSNNLGSAIHGIPDLSNKVASSTTLNDVGAHSQMAEDVGDGPQGGTDGTVTIGTIKISQDQLGAFSQSFRDSNTPTPGTGPQDSGPSGTSLEQTLQAGPDQDGNSQIGTITAPSGTDLSGLGNGASDPNNGTKPGADDVPGGGAGPNGSGADGSAPVDAAPSTTTSGDTQNQAAPSSAQNGADPSGNNSSTPSGGDNNGNSPTTPGSSFPNPEERSQFPNPEEFSEFPNPEERTTSVLTKTVHSVAPSIVNVPSVSGIADRSGSS